MFLIRPELPLGPRLYSVICYNTQALGLALGLSKGGFFVLS